MNNCYIYITGLDPIGTLYSTTVCNEMRKIKEQRFYIYYRSQTNIFDEFKVFNKFIQRLKNNYDKFYIIGHSYGAIFAKYFAHKLKNNNVVSVSLDGSDLIETCEFIAYDILKLDRSNKIDYTSNDFPTCKGINLIQKWFKQFGKCECTWKN